MSESTLKGVGQRYIGRISHIHQSGRFGYISRASIRTATGRTVVDFLTQEDIFVHLGDATRRVALRIGMEVEFMATADQKRENCYRAIYWYETDASVLEGIAAGGINLSIQGYEHKRLVEHPDAFITWCLTPSLAARVKELLLAKKAVRLLLVIGHCPDDNHWWHEKRQLIDLAEPMSHLGFSEPGTYRTFAAIVWADKEHELVDTYLSKDSGMFKTTVVSSDGMSMPYLADKADRNVDDLGPPIFGSGFIEAEVPAELFVQKPRDWAWVNKWFKDPPRDQCAYRWRRAFAYTIQPLLHSLIFLYDCAEWVARLVVVLLLLSLGARHIDYDAIRRWKYDFKWIWRQVDGSVLSLKVWGQPIPLLLPLAPFWLAVIALVGALLVRGGAAESWLVGSSSVLCAALICTAIRSVYIMWVAEPDRVQRKLDEQHRKEAEAAAAEEHERIRIADELVCSATGPRIPDPMDMPLSGRTVRFVALAVKQRVCRPFA